MLKYYKNVVRYNEKVPYGVGIITGWKDIDMIMDLLSEESKEKVVTCGKLQTINGINYIIANLFLNPQITDLVLIEDSSPKEEMADGIQSFLQFLNTGIIPFQKKFQFSDEEIQKFVSYYKTHTYVVKRKDLDNFLQKWNPTQENWCEIKEIPEEEVELLEQIPSEKISFTVRANTVLEAWKRALKLIQTYGYKKPSDYDENQLELIDLSIVVKNESLLHPTMEGVAGVTKEELEKYEQDILSPKKPDGVKYTYGNRLLDYEGVNQLQYMIDMLKEKKYSRRSIATLWNPPLDIAAGEGPCLDVYQAIVQDDYLYLISYIRSNDVYNAWPRNIYGLLKIQEALCNELGFKKGYVNTVAGSAHVYERNFKDLQEQFQGHQISFCDEDERGYFIIETNNQVIEVTFYDKKGTELRHFIGTSAEELRTQCSLYVSNIDHAVYLGQELMKAEIALQNQLSYTQDKELGIKPKIKSLQKNS